MNAKQSNSRATVDAYCRQKAGPEGSTAYYCLRFSPPDARKGLTALFALKRELDEVVEHCTELSVAEHKLGFWSDSLQQLFLDSTALDSKGLHHPVVRGLAELVQRRTLEQQDLVSILAATHDRLRTPQVLSESELMQICQITAGQFARIGMRHVRDCSPDPSDEWTIADETKARDAGAIIERVRLLWPAQRAGLPPHSSVPRDLLVEFDIDRSALDRGNLGNGIAQMMRYTIGALLDAVAQRQADLDQRTQVRAYSGFLRGQLQIAQRELSRAQRRQQHRLEPLLPIEKLWIAWRNR